MSASRPDLPLLPGGYRASRGRTRSPSSPSSGKSGRDAVTTHGELVSTTGSRLWRDHGFSRLVLLPPPQAPIGPIVARSARPAASARSSSVRCAPYHPPKRGVSGQSAAAAKPQLGPCRQRFTRIAGGLSTTGQLADDGPTTASTGKILRACSSPRSLRLRVSAAATLLPGSTTMVCRCLRFQPVRKGACLAAWRGQPPPI